MNEHEYFRPHGADQVSGIPGNDRPYHRSPCPAVNTLANHGFLPRDGKNLTPEMLQDAIMDQFHVSRSLAKVLTKPVPLKFTLADLCQHHLIEHDASLAHDDVSERNPDASVVNASLVDALCKHADKEDRIVLRVMAKHRRERERLCAASNPNYSLSMKEQVVAYSEAAAFLRILGDYKTSRISAAHARSFLLDEKFPDGFQKSKSVINPAPMLLTAFKIKWSSWWQRGGKSTAPSP